MSLEVLDRLLAALKSTPRTGWMLRGVPAAIAETIAEHLAESSILALYISEKLASCGISVDPYRAAAIAVSHDLAEAVIGDIVKKAVELIGRDVKERAEMEALKELGDMLPARLAVEYIEANTAEALAAKIAETLATLLQAIRYVKQGYTEVCEIALSMANSLERILDKHDRKLHQCLDREIGNTIRIASALCSSRLGMG
jgi:putative hydrolase of HD superfamily